MRALIAWVFVALAQAAGAQPIEVRSGEHPTFSRLVFEFETVPEWSIERAEIGYILATNVDRAFDLAGVFDRIPATRLRDIQMAGRAGAVSLDVACICHIKAFELRDSLLVVDIHDGPDPNTDTLALTRVQYVQAVNADAPILPAPPVGATNADVMAPDASPMVVRRSAPTGLPRPDTNAPRPATDAGLDAFRDALLRAHSGGGGATERLSTQSLLPHDLQAVVDRQGLQRAALDETLESLGRAAAQGLIDARPIETLNAPTLRPNGGVSPLEEFGANITASTSIDRANSGFAPSVSGLRGGICLSGSVIDVASWGDLDQPYLDLAKARASLVGEFDVTDIKAVRRLSRLYINMGFGAEARAVLKAFPSNDPETRLLLTLAELVDGLDLEDPGPLAGQLECESNAAFWAALAAPFTSDQITRSRAQILSTFSALPVHLRRHLGPALMERLTAAGDTDAAANVLNAIRRDGFKGDARMAMAVAALSTERGIPTPPPAPDAVAGDTRLLAETVLRRIKAGADNGTLPNDEDMALLPILAFELRGSDTARDLRIAEVNGYRRRGEIPPALAALRHARETNAIDQETAEELFRAVALAAADSMSDASLLVFATTADERLGVGPVSVEARRALADRLIRLGFANTAEQMVDDIPGEALENRIRLARIELARGNATEALRVLEEQSGPEVADLRARAYSDLAAHREAATVWDGIGQTEAALIARQRAGDWTELEADKDALSSAATTLRQTEDVPLANLDLRAVDGRAFRDAADAAVDASAARQEAMRALLDASAPP